MNFLIDAQLPSKLAEVMRRNQFNATHVIELDLGNSSDKDIWNHALKQNLVLITKDEDFKIWVDVLNPSPKVIWLKLGNCKNRVLIEKVIQQMPNIIQALKTEEKLVTIY